MKKHIAIMGTRGVPAAHGGFETFAEYLSLYLVAQGWDVTVYCQSDEPGIVTADEWCGVHRVTIPVIRKGAAGTMEFDWLSIRHCIASGHKNVLTLGYNTAVFCALYKFNGIKNVINMDGIEWRRDKWSFYAKIWLWLNEVAGGKLGDHLVADNPEIARHLARISPMSKITMIPYGAPLVESANPEVLTKYGLIANQFATVIARPEPENSVLEIVRAFSSERRGVKLAVLGNYDPDANSFHAEVIRSASDEVLFLGAIYDKSEVQALRYYSLFYAHGHRVGGTNPSLVEALGCGNVVLAHDNPFNRWVCGGAGVYFANEQECSTQIGVLLGDPSYLDQLEVAVISRYKEEFTWDKVLRQYEDTLISCFYSL